MPKRTTTYHKILKQFTKQNNKLSEDKKVSYKERRRIIKEDILPKFKAIPKYKIRVKDIKADIATAYSKIPPKQLCDLNFIDVASQYAYVEWFALDDTITNLVPDCVYVKVTAGGYGETKIFNTRNYEYGKNGVRAIVENIRPDAQNASGKYVFSGFQKLRPRKKNDGSPENYYLDFVLFEIDRKGRQTPLGDTTTTRFEPPKTRENRAKKTKIKNIIEGKIKQLKAKREGKKRAKKTLEKNITNFGKTIKKLSKSKNPEKARAVARQNFLKSLELLEKYKKQGKLSPAQYKVAFDKIFKEFNQ